MKVVVALLACTFATIVVGTKPHEYLKAAREAVKRPNFMESLATTAVGYMVGRDAAEFDVDISNKPQLQLFAKIMKKPDAFGVMVYYIEISLKKPKSIEGLNIAVVRFRSMSNLKKAFVDALTHFLQSFKPTIAYYGDAVKKFGKKQREKEVENAVNLLREKDSVRYLVIFFIGFIVVIIGYRSKCLWAFQFKISNSPKLVFGWHIRRIDGKYKIHIYLAKPERIPGFNISGKEMTVRISKLRGGLAEILDLMLNDIMSKG